MQSRLGRKHLTLIRPNSWNTNQAFAAVDKEIAFMALEKEEWTTVVNKKKEQKIKKKGAENHENHVLDTKTLAIEPSSINPIKTMNKIRRSTRVLKKLKLKPNMLLQGKMQWLA